MASQAAIVFLMEEAVIGAMGAVIGGIITAAMSWHTMRRQIDASRREQDRQALLVAAWNFWLAADQNWAAVRTLMDAMGERRDARRARDSAAVVELSRLINKAREERRAVLADGRAVLAQLQTIWPEVGAVASELWDASQKWNYDAPEEPERRRGAALNAYEAKLTEIAAVGTPKKRRRGWGSCASTRPGA